MNKKLTILSTRELDQAIVDQVHERDVVFDQIPFIEMISRDDEQLKSTVSELASEDALCIFTSRVAVATVTSMLGSARPAWKIACMGGATKKQASDFFGEDAIAFTSGTARELGTKLLSLQPQSPVVFFAGNRRLNDLPDLLDELGSQMTEVIVYDTIETPVLVDNEYDAILFFSPSAAKSFFSLNKAGGHTVLFSIGETTATVLRELSTNKIVVSAVHSPEVLLDTVFRHFEIQEIK